MKRSRQGYATRRAIARAERRREECERAYRKTSSWVWLARLREAVTACLRLERAGT